MDAIEAARQEAERIHHAAIASGNNPDSLIDFVTLEASRRGLDVYEVTPGDPQLKGGKATYDSQAGVILYESKGTSFDRAFLIAHELGHVVIEGGKEDVVTEHVEQDRSVEDSPVGVETVIDYGSKERREVLMDLFAREFLVPRFMVRNLHLDKGYSSEDIASLLQAPLQVIQQQLLDAILLPVFDTPSINTTPLLIEPDPIQIEAAEHRGTAYQLQAGPGTGKTRTLVRRIESLLAEGVDPATILVLTFSNKAAKELCERISASNPTAVAAMWIGTFHAFGLDIIRRFHDKLGLPANPRLVDKAEAIELLENEFPRLSFRHYRNLWDPILDLNDMLSAISRAKDEVCDASDYRILAQNMLDQSGEDLEARLRAEKCLEVALLFETYERLMSAEQKIDFGDLVAQPVRLVETELEVRLALAARHKHILVDEYQDVNRASVRLLKAIAGDGRNLWVVGDARQSIYRFRGASASNMAQFSDDFPGARVRQLGVNYRSSKEVVDVFTSFSQTMKASTGSLPLKLTANKGASNISTEFRVVGSTENEISAVAAAILACQQEGTPYRQQAVLCVSNTRLSEIAKGLEARDIPVLHLGSIFERPEIKDLLTLLSMLTDPHAVGLIRVATIPSYEMPLQDAMRIIKYFSENHSIPLKWCQLESEIPGLTSESQAVLTRVTSLFAKLKPTDNPWAILATWVIDRLKIAKALYLKNDPQSRMKRLALWQFLNFCRNQPQGSGFPSVRLLNRIRRLVLLSEDRGLRQLPLVAEGIDAVRLMTIHASKGLEFQIVHIPGMVTSGLPRNNKPPRCVPPDGLIYGSAGLTGLEAVKAGHNDEEECLFFVALSRARDRLFLYASSLQTGGKKRNPSKFIDVIERLLFRPSSPPLHDGQLQLAPNTSLIWAQKPVWSDNQINQFEHCPRRFLYTYVLKLGGRRTETAFQKMHNVVSDMFDWLKTAHETSNPSETEISEHFETVWKAKGLTKHGYAEDFHRIARQLINFLNESRNRGTRSKVTPITLSWAEGDILVIPDSVAHSTQGQIKINRTKTGKKPSNDFDDIEYTLLQLAAIQAYGERGQVEVTYLTNETTEPLLISANKFENRRQKAEQIMQNIRSGNFSPKAEARVCPRCPSYFICGDLPDGELTIKI